MLTMNGIERSMLVAVLAAIAMAARAGPPADASPKGLTPAPLTQEQGSAKDESDTEQANCKERRREQFQRDVALLDRYLHEEDLQEARYGALGEQMKQIDQANERLKQLIANGRDLLEKAKFFEPPHQMPDDLRRARDFNRELEQIEFRRIGGAAHEIQRVNDDYDAKLKRYRQLVDGAAKMPCDLKND
jgi:hypothetical protein